MYKYICRFAILIACLCSCSVQRQTKFTSDRLVPGISKNAVFAIYGKPYKQTLDTASDGKILESWYYKEELYQGRWYEVNNILHFENGMFKSLEQGQEKPLYPANKVIIQK